MAAASLAETRARSRLGIAMAAMIPMIATTIRSSIRVKPPAVLRTFLRPALPSIARLRESRGGAPCSPPNLQGSLVTLLQNLAGRRRDGDATQGVARGHAG